MVTKLDDLDIISKSSLLSYMIDTDLDYIGDSIESLISYSRPSISHPKRIEEYYYRKNICDDAYDDIVRYYEFRQDLIGRIEELYPSFSSNLDKRLSAEPVVEDTKRNLRRVSRMILNPGRIAWASDDDDYFSSLKEYISSREDIISDVVDTYSFSDAVMIQNGYLIEELNIYLVAASLIEPKNCRLVETMSEVKELIDAKQTKIDNIENARALLHRKPKVLRFSE